MSSLHRGIPKHRTLAGNNLSLFKGLKDYVRSVVGDVGEMELVSAEIKERPERYPQCNGQLSLGRP